MTREEARAAAADAFVFGYPLVLMDASRDAFLRAPRPNRRRARTNEFAHTWAFPDASFGSLVGGCADTLRSTAWLDLSAEPVVLGVPASDGRYYRMPMLSGWTDVFAAPGSRTTGDGQGAFAVIGPEWDGRLPEGVGEIRSPTSMAWLVGRTQARSRRDYEHAHRFQAGLSLVPLSAWGRSVPPAPMPVDLDAPMAPPPPEQVAAMDAAAFFGRLAGLLVENPPAAADAPALERFAALGLAPGAFEPSSELADALDQGVRDGLAALRAMRDRPAALTNGWAIDRDPGRHGTAYARRALAAMSELGADLPEDAVCPRTAVDAGGRPLCGCHRYVLHFAPGAAPPALGCWSLTMYDERGRLVANPLDRFALGDRDRLAGNPDGSLDLWLQHARPDPRRETNWLPAPAGPFSLVLRIHWPAPAVTGGTWSPPAVIRLP